MFHKWASMKFRANTPNHMMDAGSITMPVSKSITEPCDFANSTTGINRYSLRLRLREFSRCITKSLTISEDQGATIRRPGTTHQAAGELCQDN